MGPAAGDHYFEPRTGGGVERPRVELVLPDLSFTLATDRGVFAPGAVDPGTKLLLLDGVPPRAAARPATCSTSAAATDPIAVALARRAPAADRVGGRRERAGARAVRGERRGGRARQRATVARARRGARATCAFAGIWSNPPIRIGKARAARAARARGSTAWRPAGSAWLVVQKHLGADSLARWLDGRGWPVERRSSRAGYRVLDVAAAVSRQLDGTGLKRLHREWRRRTEGRVALLLDGVSSPYNVGSILRTAAAERVEHIWFTTRATTPDERRRCGKTALGSERYLTWTTGEHGRGECGRARERPGGESSASSSPTTPCRCTRSTSRRRPCASPSATRTAVSASATLAACDEVGFVPQLGRVGSLNVAVATAIALYEARRQEWTRPSPPTPP